MVDLAAAELPGAKMIDGQRTTVSNEHVHSARGGLAVGMYKMSAIAAHALPLPILPEFSSSTPDVGGSSSDMGATNQSGPMPMLLRIRSALRREHVSNS